MRGIHSKADAGACPQARLPDRRARLTWAATAAATLLLALALSAAGASARTRPAARRAPAGLAAYTPPARLVASGRGHGRLIWARPLTGPAALAGAASNELVLYRSIGVGGRPVAVSGTVSIPRGTPPPGGWPVISWDHGTTGIADQCAPSRDTAADPVHAYIAYVYPQLEGWLRGGYAVVRTDFEGLGTPGVHPYLVGVSEARGTLDIVRAARRLAPSLSARVIIAGHSQGGQAALWAASLATSWTPELAVRGTVAFAPASHLSAQLALLPSVTSTGFGGVVSLIARGLDAADPALHVGSLLTPAAARLYPQTLTRCLPGLDRQNSFGALPGSAFFRSGADLAPVRAALVAQVDPDHLNIRTPVLIEQGGSDTTVFPAFTDQLAAELGALSDPVTYHKYAGVEHGGIVAAADADATSWIAARLGRLNRASTPRPLFCRASEVAAARRCAPEARSEE